MSRRNRYLAVGCAAALLLVGAEVGLNAILGPVAGVQLINAGAEPMERVRVIHQGQEAWVGRIEPGASATVRVRGRGKAALIVDYQQRGSALSNFEIAAFDPDALSREDFMLVLRIRPNEYERYQEDGEPSTLRRLLSRARNWLEESLRSY